MNETLIEYWENRYKERGKEMFEILNGLRQADKNPEYNQCQGFMGLAIIRRINELKGYGQ